MHPTGVAKPTVAETVRDPVSKVGQSDICSVELDEPILPQPAAARAPPAGDLHHVAGVVGECEGAIGHDSIQPLRTAESKGAS